MNEVKDFDINLLLSESRESVLNPKGYFSIMPVTGGLTYPILKVLVYGTIAGVLSWLWSIFHLSIAGAVIGGGSGIMIVIGSVIGSVIGLFIGAVILLIISSVCKGSNDFEACVRVASALMVLMPLSAAVGFLDSVSFKVATIVRALISLYGIYMMYHALILTLKAEEKSSRIASYIFAGVLVIFLISGLSGRHRNMDYYRNRDLGRVEVKI